MKNRSLMVLVAMGLVLLQGQAKRDPRSVALGGAYGTVADGIFAVGFNPALLAYQTDKPFMLQLFGFDAGIVSNYFSLANLNSISGDTLTDNKKDLLFDTYFRDQGLTLSQDLRFPIPMLNYASGNMAITSNALLITSARIPPGMMRLLLYGNAHDPTLDMELNLEMLAVAEYGFSFAMPFQAFAVGATLKYLQGIFYLGVDPDSSHAELQTVDGKPVYGSGTYFLRQGIGGSGIGLDLGVVSEEFNDGWRIGFSLTNAVGRINWNKPSLIKDILGGKDKVYGNKDDLWHLVWNGTIITDSLAIKYSYTIDSLSAQTLSDTGLFTNTQEVVRNVDANGKPVSFSTNYPSLLRISASKRFPDFIVASDLVTGFENRFFARAGWTWSIGAELTRFESFPLRIGYAWGGKDLKQLGLGFGVHKGPLIFDFALAFRNGVWIHTLKGLSLSTSLVITSFKSRKEEPMTELPPAPAPAP
ncbi:MAG: conjugal transfer protein TraF [FCB group bacterium]|nr:conjugal transfer protein TraF [FCB group bacterium]